MIVVTGGAGFIGSALIAALNDIGREDIVVVDRLSTDERWQNLAKRKFAAIVHADDFLDCLTQEKFKPTAVIHMGACSSTTELDADYLLRNNYAYSVALFEYCQQQGIPYIYASSAATYGNGENGFSDDPKLTPTLRPTNKYGFSKQIFDTWVQKQTNLPPVCVGLKFFNVYGPNEYHKDGQYSGVYHFYNQIQKTGKACLFKSEDPDFADGEQKRDFVYVKDISAVILHILSEGTRVTSGIYNLGSGTARTWIDLAKATFSACDKKSQIEFIDLPNSLKAHYQYFTEAEMSRMKEGLNYSAEMTTLEDGISDYVINYLQKPDRYL